MQSFRLIAPHTTELRTMAQPAPGPGEVLVRVGGAGVCHSDLHIIEADDALGMPLTLGHDNAGWVELAGHDNECRTTQPGGIGLSRDGGMAEHVVMPARQLIAIGDLDVTHVAVQILAATSAVRIVAVDLREEALALACDIGAHHAVRSDADAAAHIRDLVGPAPGGADIVLDFVDAPLTVALAAEVVSTGGDVAIVGLAGGALQGRAVVVPATA